MWLDGLQACMAPLSWSVGTREGGLPHREQVLLPDFLAGGDGDERDAGGDVAVAALGDEHGEERLPRGGNENHNQNTQKSL